MPHNYRYNYRRRHTDKCPRLVMALHTNRKDVIGCSKGCHVDNNMQGCQKEAAAVIATVTRGLCGAYYFEMIEDLTSNTNKPEVKASKSDKPFAKLWPFKVLHAFIFSFSHVHEQCSRLLHAMQTPTRKIFDIPEYVPLSCQFDGACFDNPWGRPWCHHDNF